MNRRGFLAGLAVGLFVGYMRLVKAGQYVPDHRHWPAIRHVIDSVHRL